MFIYALAKGAHQNYHDPKGVGAFLLAVTEIEKATSQKKVGTRLTSKD